MYAVLKADWYRAHLVASVLGSWTPWATGGVRRAHWSWTARGAFCSAGQPVLRDRIVFSVEAGPLFSITRCFCPLLCRCNLFCPEQTNDKAAASLKAVIKPLPSATGSRSQSAFYGGARGSHCVVTGAGHDQRRQSRITLHSFSAELSPCGLLVLYTSVLVEIPSDLNHL